MEQMNLSQLLNTIQRTRVVKLKTLRITRNQIRAGIKRRMKLSPEFRVPLILRGENYEPDLGELQNEPLRRRSVRSQKVLHHPLFTNELPWGVRRIVTRNQRLLTSEWSDSFLGRFQSLLLQLHSKLCIRLRISLVKEYHHRRSPKSHSRPIVHWSQKTSSWM